MTFCLDLSRCRWVEPGAVPQQRRAELPAEGHLPKPAAPSEGKPITAHSEGHMPCGPTPIHLCVGPQVNLLPELMQAFSDTGGGACLFLNRPHLTGKWRCQSQPEPETDPVQSLFLENIQPTQVATPASGSMPSLHIVKNFSRHHML